MKIEGVLELYEVIGPKSSARGDYYIHAISVKGVKYNALGKKGNPLGSAGDIVSFDSIKKGQYLNFDPASFEVKGKDENYTPPTPQKPKDVNASIARQNALRHATQLVCQFESQLPSEVAVMKVLELCKDYIFPYIDEGIFPEAPPQPKKQDTKKQESDEFGDDIPF